MFVRAGATSHAVVAATSNAVAYPTLSAGDLLVLVAVIGNNPTVGADPTGFANQASLSSSALTLSVRCYLRLADGSETGSATVTWTGSQNSVAAMVAISGFTAGSIVLDPAAAVTVSSGTSYSRTGGTAGGSGKDDAVLAIAAGTNATGAAAITVTSTHGKVAEIYGGSTPFLGLAIACGGVLQPQTTGATFTATDTRTTTANYVAQFGVQLPYATTYTPIAVPEATGLEALSPEYTYTPIPVPGAPANLEFVVVGAWAAWPTSGQGWPRIKQG